MNKRIVARLDIKGPNLVKGVQLEGLRVMGKPEKFANYYYENGVDELFFNDVVASLYGRNSLLHIVEKTSREIFIPLTVGGGIRTIDDILAILRAGADKVYINTAGIQRPEFISEASQHFGSSTIVVGIEAKRQSDGSYEAYTDSGRERTGVDALHWAKTVEQLGAGEIFLTSVDNEGTGRGFDLNLVHQVTQAVSIPVVACGGAGSTEHVVEVLSAAGADAAAVASMLHYYYISCFDSFSDDYSTEGNIEFLREQNSRTRIEPSTISQIKQHLIQQGIECRPMLRGD